MLYKIGIHADFWQKIHHVGGVFVGDRALHAHAPMPVAGFFPHMDLILCDFFFGDPFSLRPGAHPRTAQLLQKSVGCQQNAALVGAGNVAGSVFC